MGSREGPAEERGELGDPETLQMATGWKENFLESVG